MSVRLIGVVGGGGGGGSGDISGTGIVGQVAEFVTDTKTIQAANLIAPANVLTLVAGAAYTLTIPKTGTPLIAGDNLSDVTTRQTAVNNLTAVAGATNEHVLTKDTATGNAVFKAAAGGGGSPGGADTQVQFNDGGSFGGDAGLVYNKTNDTLTISGADAVRLILKGNASQTANLVEWRKSDGTVFAAIQGRGTFYSNLGTPTTNLFIGYGAGIATASGGYNVALGESALDALTSGTNNTAIGRNALGAVTTGSYNLAIGTNTLGAITTTSSNTGVGAAALAATNTGYNTAIGQGSLGSCLGGNNVGIGVGAGLNITAGNYNIFLGNYAGANQGTNSYRFVVDSLTYPGRADAATEITNAILYGVMAAAPANQTLRINAYLSVTGDVRPTADNTYYLGKNDDDTPFAWKGVILKDTTNGKYYRVEVISGVVTATDLTD